MFFKANSAKGVLIHVAIILVIAVAIIASFFFLYLPTTTHHGETIAVPKLTGMQIYELDRFLGNKHLRYQINDSTYSPGVKPNTILSQHPLPGTHVKENRKIYISVSSKNPPKVKMPKLVDGSLKSAEITLKSYDLQLGNVKYVSSPYLNLVINQKVGDKSVEPGSYISKGTKVNLEVGNGSGGELIELPNIIGMDIEEAKALLEEKGLIVGFIKGDTKSTEPDGTVVKQEPQSGKIKTGEMVNIWISGKGNAIIFD